MCIVEFEKIPTIYSKGIRKYKLTFLTNKTSLKMTQNFQTLPKLEL